MLDKVLQKLFRRGYNASENIIQEYAMLENLITVDEAVKRSGLSGVYIRRLARQGRIKGRLMGTTWIIDPESLDAFLESERKPGRPPLDK